ncbi:MAG: alkaline phosphatase family protein, partial [Planctomycetota bacterium]
MTPARPEPPGGRALVPVLFVLLGLVVVGRLATRAWLASPAPTRLPRVGATTAVARPLLFVVLDGLREPSSWTREDGSTPWLRAFAGLGASGIAWAGDPTLTAPCVRALLTGRAPDLVTGFRNFDAEEVPGNLLQYLRERGARTAHAGDATIYQFCRRAFDSPQVLAIPDQGPTDTRTDAKAVAFAVDRILEGADVLTLHLTLPDHTGHMHGAVGEEYAKACRTTDERTREVVEAFLDVHPDALVFVGADHGVSANGTHGGGEIVARRAPFLLVGPGVARVHDVEISQYAVAPTIAALLGLPMPPLADAPPAPQLLDLPEADVRHALDSYLQARLAVARSLGSRDVDPIERKRADLSIRRLAGDDAGKPFRALAAELNRILNPSSAGYALLALFLAALGLVASLHLVARAPFRGPGGGLVAAGLAVSVLAALGLLPVLAAGLLLLVACAAVLLLARPRRGGGAVFVLAVLAA